MEYAEVFFFNEFSLRSYYTLDFVYKSKGSENF